MQLEDRFYKSTEVADLLGVSLRTLYRYMENAKIQSVHLPSGRHRFTKQQIEEFLYSNSFTDFDNSASSSNSSYNSRPASQYTAPDYNKRDVKPLEQASKTYEPQGASTPINNKVVMPTDEELDQQLDALLKSLEDTDSNESVSATKDISFEQKTVSSAPVSTPTTPIEPNTYRDEQDDELDALLKSLQEEDEEPAVTPNVQGTPQTSGFGINAPVNNSTSDSFGGFRIKPNEPAFNENEINYFYCPHSDLRTIAKIIKKVGDDHGLKYAFTLNAGASLFFPLDPFSMIHFYVHVNDLDIWKRELQLSSSNQSEANIGILLTKGSAFINSSEVSGLKVVGRDKLIENLKSKGNTDLALEVEKRL